MNPWNRRRESIFGNSLEAPRTAVRGAPRAGFIEGRNASGANGFPGLGLDPFVVFLDEIHQTFHRVGQMRTAPMRPLSTRSIRRRRIRRRCQAMVCRNPVQEHNSAFP